MVQLLQKVSVLLQICIAKYLVLEGFAVIRKASFIQRNNELNAAEIRPRCGIHFIHKF